MSYHAEFTARFAPIDEWHRVGGINERYTESAFTMQGLSKYPEVSREIPVVLRHEKDKVAGRIESLWPMEGWWHARFKLTPSLWPSAVAVDHLKVGTPVSVGFSKVRSRDSGASRLFELCWMKELSILMWEQRPAYRGAQVMHVREPQQRQWSEAEIDALLERARNLPPLPDLPKPAGGVYYGPRDPLEDAWAKDAYERGAIVRSGTGQVLRVR
jgi:hypothetical protein